MIAAFAVDAPISERDIVVGTKPSEADRRDVRLAAFARALLDPAHAVPSGLVGPDGQPSARRFNVYRNNVVASLTRVLRAAFPATASIVGEEFFAAMARVHVAEEPPASALLFEYGAGFPDFIRRFEPAADLVYLPDVAYIEWAWIEAYHAREARHLGPDAFARMSPDDLPFARLALHPSLHIVRSPFPAATIWRMNTGREALKPVDLGAGAEDVLVVRPDADVAVLALLPGAADFLFALRDMRCILDATAAALDADPRFDLSANLSALIGARIFVEFL